MAEFQRRRNVLDGNTKMAAVDGEYLCYVKAFRNGEDAGIDKAEVRIFISEALQKF